MRSFGEARSPSPGHLAHALAGGVVDVPGALAAAQVGLGAADRLASPVQLVPEVPLHHLQVRHAQHVAVRVVAVRLDLRRVAPRVHRVR